MKRKIYEIWCEGFDGTQGHHRAKKLGEGGGVDFKDACDTFALSNREFRMNYDRKAMSYWGCALVESEAEARKSFG